MVNCCESGSYIVIDTLNRIPFGAVDYTVPEDGILFVTLFVVFHCRVFFGVCFGQMCEHVVVFTDRLLSLTGTVVIVRIIGHNCPAVKVGRQYERNRVNPSANGRRLRLFRFIVLLEKVREIAVQIEVLCIQSMNWLKNR